MTPRIPLLFNAQAGIRAKDPDALMGRLSPEVRARIEPVPFGPPWDFEPHVAQARAAGGPLLVWGGDGTLHHAGRYLAAHGCPVALGAVPGGSGNGLVRGLRTPLEPAGAVQRLLEGRELAMDLPRLDGVPFLNLCGTGFEAEVAHLFDSLPGRGFRTYALACLRLYRTHRDLGLAWEAEDAAPAAVQGRVARLKAAWQGPAPALPEAAWSLTLANLPQFGSGLWIAPGADPTDGQLSWVRLSRPGLLDMATEVPTLFREGGWTRLRQEGVVRRTRLRLDRPCFWHLDGEPAPSRDEAELWVEPRGFRMQVTGACPWS